jgi:hypothetical protein
MKTKLFLIAIAVMAFVGTSYAQTKADKTTGKDATATETVQTDAATEAPIMWMPTTMVFAIISKTTPTDVVTARDSETFPAAETAKVRVCVMAKGTEQVRMPAMVLTL